MERYYLGVDWADEFHQVWVCDGEGKKVIEIKLAQKAEAMSEFGRWLDERRAQGAATFQGSRGYFRAQRGEYPAIGRDQYSRGIAMGSGADRPARGWPVVGGFGARRSSLEATLSGQRIRPLADRFRDRLLQTYGAEQGKRVEYVEAFEVSEYGAPLDAEARPRLFPFLPPLPTAASSRLVQEWVDIRDDE